MLLFCIYNIPTEAGFPGLSITSTAQLMEAFPCWFWAHIV